jgi:hypothetical protein
VKKLLETGEFPQAPLVLGLGTASGEEQPPLPIDEECSHPDPDVVYASPHLSSLLGCAVDGFCVRSISQRAPMGASVIQGRACPSALAARARRA